MNKILVSLMKELDFFAESNLITSPDIAELGYKCSDEVASTLGQIAKNKMETTMLLDKLFHKLNLITINNNVKQGGIYYD